MSAPAVRLYDGARGKQGAGSSRYPIGRIITLPKTEWHRVLILDKKCLRKEFIVEENEASKRDRALRM